MNFNNSFRFLAAESDTGGTNTVDRGDELVPPVVVTPPPVAEDPKVKALEVEIDAEIDEKDDEKDEARKDSRIPQARHKEILEKERAKTSAALAENAQLKQRAQLSTAGNEAGVEFAAVEAQILVMEDEYATLLTDGEIKKATAVMARIRASERQMADARADLKVRASSLQAQEVSRYDTALTRIETAYPQLNPDHEAYSEVTMNRVARMARANQADGMTSVAALQDAVETIIGADTTQQQRATSDTPRAEKDVGAERKAAAVAKVVAAVAKTPPSLNRVGLDSDKRGTVDHEAATVINMSQKDFANVSDADLAKLRGDTV